ncbi:ABC-F family ATP-binding cassette domain-containing protein [Arthrobacter sp. 35W]|uniref:ABC-F family ATP-binding cassette domain-containing protein n=1 Tax=Arthrobacter sp. 35W TaxID=1132441 RepID=UPI0004043A38|nr:ABC-F family ATP-binding cassette domain-containing protein [Arthrobacter sp. 35W]
MTAQLSLSSLSHGYADRLLLDRVDLEIVPGEHIAIIGENGAGKSTLLRLMAGIEEPDGGSVTVEGAVAYLAQVPEAPPGSTIADFIDNALASFRDLEARLREAADALAAGDDVGELYGSLQDEFALREGYSVDSRLDSALGHLGLEGLDRARQLDSLSGGERQRLALAALLADPPPIMLLDEPTNHLDADSADWLEARLAAHRGTVVAVSHDRTFLLRVATAVVEVDGDTCSVERFGNGYLGYLGEKAAARARWEQEYQQWQDELAANRLQASTIKSKLGYGRRRDGDKMSYGVKAETWEKAAASRVRNAHERVKRLEENPVPRPPEPLHLSIPSSEPITAAGDATEADLAAARQHAARRFSIQARDISVGQRLHVPFFEVRPGEKVMVAGPNGAGKSTLLDVLAGAARPDAGSVQRIGAVGYLPQELHTPAHPHQRLLPAFLSGMVGEIDELADRLLRLGLFKTSDFHLPVGSMSAGQRRRLALARLLAVEHDTILMDEPTNHLAPLLVGELEEALAGFEGALVLVSHDRALRRWFDGQDGARLVELESGSLIPDTVPTSMV